MCFYQFIDLTAGMIKMGAKDCRNDDRSVVGGGG